VTDDTVLPGLRASIIVPTGGRRRLVERLLDGLSRQTADPTTFEAIVISDGATDGTVELVEGYQSVFPLVCLARPHRGRSAARNAGIAAARGDVLLMLDDDMEPVPGWLESHLVAHGAALRRCVLGAVPVRDEPDASPLEQWIKRNFEEHGEKLAEPGYALTLADFYSGNTSIRRAVLDEVGGFDEDFSLLYGNEDVELFGRLRAAGVEVTFSAEARAIQEYHKTFRDFARDARDTGRTAVLLARKHPELGPELVHFRGGRGVWRRVNGVLLWLARRSEAVPRLVVALESLVARLVPARRMPGFYWRASNFYFWLGVDDKQQGGEPVLRR